MDLYAYAQIESIGEVMNQNGINVPRLRGLRLMKDETPLAKEQIEKKSLDIGLQECEFLCCSNFTIDSNWHEFSDRTMRTKKKYLIKDQDEFVIGIRWNVAHGDKRKKFKYVLKRARKKVGKTYEVFNKYCGRDDVLYIHARIGGLNWVPYGGRELAQQDWFLEKVDDPFDNTYCDIYAKIKSPLTGGIKNEQDGSVS